MKKSKNTRRQFVKTTAAGLSLLSLPSLLHAQTNKQADKKKIVCIGGHPDDPESGCGGTLAKFANAGCAITIIYLTTGEAGIEGKTHDEAAAIRKQEAINACKILNARAVFAGQIDGDTVINNEWINKMQQFIANEKPDIVFTHWPIDSHKDHQAASMLTIQAWMHSQQKFLLYFFEVCAGNQTMAFRPTDYVDISDTQEQKRKAIFCHTSQDPDSIYGCGHAAMEEFRGRELGVKAGEGFVRMNGRGMGGIIL
ncbi:MAG TPA: PIG-L deacetylase family protein [Chitinophagaceae bacterium]|jgi:LmbE family N-acetylglucosaminyl deacetylase